MLTTDQRSFGIDTGGTLWAWGDEVGGRLGLSETDAHASTPIEVDELTPFTTTRVASGKDYTYARVWLDESWQWVWWGRGRNNFEASAGGDPDFSLTTPTMFPDDQVTAIAAFWEESIAAKKDGSVVAWRPNDGVSSAYSISGFHSRVVDVRTHGGDAAALDDAGRVYFWKLESRWTEALSPFSGRLDPFYESMPSYVNLRSEPTLAFSEAGTVFQSISITSGGVLLALDSSGVVWAAGPNKPWAIAGSEETDWVNGSRVAGLPPITQVTGFRGRGFALDEDGRVWTWGVKTTHQMFSEERAPVVVPELDNTFYISANAANFLALTSD